MKRVYPPAPIHEEATDKNLQLQHHRDGHLILGSCPFLFLASQCVGAAGYARFTRLQDVYEHVLRALCSARAWQSVEMGCSTRASCSEGNLTLVD